MMMKKEKNWQAMNYVCEYQQTILKINIQKKQNVINITFFNSTNQKSNTVKRIKYSFLKAQMVKIKHFDGKL